MDSRRSTQRLAVDRHYEEQEEVCAKALKVLLERAAGKTSANGDGETEFGGSALGPIDI